MLSTITKHTVNLGQDEGGREKRRESIEGEGCRDEKRDAGMKKGMQG
jgi:hypothetical protein